MIDQDDRTAGFTLIEVLIALVILALASGFAFSTVSDSFDRLSQADMEQQAVTVAETALARLGHDLPVRPGKTSGTDGRLTWRSTLERLWPIPRLRPPCSLPGQRPRRLAGKWNHPATSLAERAAGAATAPSMRQHEDAGFTLVELLIAIALLGMLTVLAYGAVQFGNLSWRHASVRRDADADRAAVRRLLGRSIETAYRLSHRPTMPTVRSPSMASRQRCS